MRRAGLAVTSAIFLLLCGGPLAGCASQRSCKDRAAEQYRMCTNPQYFPEGAPHDVPRGDEALQCQQAYQQAVSQCDGGETEIVGPTLTSTDTATRNP